MKSWLDDLVGRAHETLLTDPTAAKARDYLRSRGVLEPEWVTYRLGYSAPSLQIGACTKEFNDWFKQGWWFQRIVFPLTTTLGATIGIVTRPPPEPGEKRAYQQFYLHKDERYPFLFGLQQALPEIWRTQQVVIVEGVFDYFALARHVPNTVAILTASPPATARRFFTRYVRQVWAVLDMDAAGRFGAYRLAGLTPPEEFWPEGWQPGRAMAPKGYQVMIVAYQNAKDPGQLSEIGQLDDLLQRLEGVRTAMSP